MGGRWIVDQLLLFGTFTKQMHGRGQHLETRRRSSWPFWPFWLASCCPLQALDQGAAQACQSALAVGGAGARRALETDPWWVRLPPKPLSGRCRCLARPNWGGLVRADASPLVTARRRLQSWKGQYEVKGPGLCCRVMRRVDRDVVCRGRAGEKAGERRRGRLRADPLTSMGEPRPRPCV